MCPEAKLNASSHDGSRSKELGKPITSSNFALVHKQLLDGELVIGTGLEAEAGVIMQDDMGVGVVNGIGVASPTRCLILPEVQKLAGDVLRKHLLQVLHEPHDQLLKREQDIGVGSCNVETPSAA